MPNTKKAATRGRKKKNNVKPEKEGVIRIKKPDSKEIHMINMNWVPEPNPEICSLSKDKMLAIKRYLIDKYQVHESRYEEAKARIDQFADSDDGSTDHDERYNQATLHYGMRLESMECLKAQQGSLVSLVKRILQLEQVDDQGYARFDNLNKNRNKKNPDKFVNAEVIFQCYKLIYNTEEEMAI